MNREDKWFAFAGACILAVSCAGMSFSGTRAYYESKYQTEAIEHGAAEYDSKTGAWKWKELPTN